MLELLCATLAVLSYFDEFKPSFGMQFSDLDSLFSKL